MDSISTCGYAVKYDKKKIASFLLSESKSNNNEKATFLLRLFQYPLNLKRNGPLVVKNLKNEFLFQSSDFN